jgi:hypothetical protein
MIVPSKQSVIVRLGWSSTSYPVNDRFPQLLELSAEQ